MSDYKRQKAAFQDTMRDLKKSGLSHSDARRATEQIAAKANEGQKK